MAAIIDITVHKNESLTESITFVDDQTDQGINMEGSTFELNVYSKPGDENAVLTANVANNRILEVGLAEGTIKLDIPANLLEPMERYFELVRTFEGGRTIPVVVGKYVTIERAAS